jgi:tRNA pseudouridine32 synthase/23S rRNA pseudouridine746 synthase
MTQPIDTFVAPPCGEDIRILYQDDSLLLINKPSGLLSLSGKNPLNWDSVHYRLVQQFPSALLLHRLDLGTSGVLVIALNKQIAADINRQFQARTVVKTYQALLAGWLTDESGQIDLPIAKDPAIFPRLKVCMTSGKPASSHYRVMERLIGQGSQPERTRVQFSPLTGRTHQLRIHSAALGHPILGCDLYGTPESEQMASRLQLHAETLEFDHPVSGARFFGRSDCPF